MNQPQWIHDFIAAHGRPPRILHVGNVANNAYQNAKMLNAAGADCDVLCADYYHIMGCPEWDDATITGDVGSQVYPAWHKVDLHGFERPRWFIQAPRRIAIAYLIARRTGDTATCDKLWKTSGRISRYYSFRETSRLKRLLLWGEKLAFSAMALVRRVLSRPAKPAPPAQPQDTAPQDPLLARLNADAAILFPGRDIQFKAGWDSDYTPDQAALYAPLFPYYDVVQGYATDCIWPYLAGFENYTAYEHGTLRDFPRQDTDTAHLALLAYARAKAITVTNVDCYENALYVAGPAATPVVCGLHGIDMSRIIQKVEAARGSLTPADRFDVPPDVPAFYCPSRHNFQKEYGAFLKGEDKAIRAAARLADEGEDFRLVMADWGDEVDQIKAMIAGYPSLERRVQWTPPLSKDAFYRAFLSVDAVLDQFYLYVFGGIDFEVLCASSAVLISNRAPREEYVIKFFGQPIPYYPCTTEDEIYTAMLRVIDQPQETKALAARGRDWILACHSDERIVEKNCQAFAHCIPMKG